jgi:hypothetical protein
MPSQPLSDLSIIRILDELLSWKFIIAYLLISASKDKFATPFGELSYLNGRVVLNNGSSIFLVCQKISEKCCLQNEQGNQQNLEEVHFHEGEELLFREIPKHVSLSFLEKSKLDDMSTYDFWELFTVLVVPMSLKKLMTFKIVKPTETKTCQNAPSKPSFDANTTSYVQEPKNTLQTKISEEQTKISCESSKEIFDGSLQESPKPSSNKIACQNAPVKRRTFKANKSARSSREDKENCCGNSKKVCYENRQREQECHSMKRKNDDIEYDSFAKRINFEIE